MELLANSKLDIWKTDSGADRPFSEVATLSKPELGLAGARDKPGWDGCFPLLSLFMVSQPWMWKQVFLGDKSFSIALLLNEVSEKRREICNEMFSEICPEICPEIRRKISLAFLAGRKVLPQISPRFSHRRFQISNQFPNQISPKIPQHTSAGLADLKVLERHGSQN